MTAVHFEALDCKHIPDLLCQFIQALHFVSQ